MQKAGLAMADVKGSTKLAAGRKIRRGVKHSGGSRIVNHARSHMVYTEAQSLDEALDMIGKQKRMVRHSKKWGKRQKEVDAALGYLKTVNGGPTSKTKTITLPRVKFLERGRAEKDNG